MTLSPGVPPSGWFTAAPEVTISGAETATFDVSIDGGPKQPYLAPFSPTGLANGSHVIEVTGSDGSSAFITIRIDSTPPVIDVTLSPLANSAGWHRSTVTATFDCTDSVSGIASCSPPASTGAQEGTDLALSGTATDLAGLTTTTTRTVKVDLTSPTVPVVSLDPATRAEGQASTLTATSSDALSGLIGGEWWIGDDPGQGNATPLNLSGSVLSGLIPATLPPGTYVVSARSLDVAGNWSDAGTATLNVQAPENGLPTATPLTATTSEDTAVAIVLAGSDPDVTDTLSFDVVTEPAHGTLSGDSPNLTYTPAANFNGADSFSFTASDGLATSDPATVSIDVAPVNDAPTVSAPASVDTTEGASRPITATVADVDGDTVSVVWVVLPGGDVDAGADCTIANLAATSITCTDDGTYTAIVIASDGFDGAASAQTLVSVRNANPAVAITGATPNPVLPGAQLDVSASIVDAGANDTHTCAVDWGDGSSTPGTVAASACSASHAYATKGTKTVVVTVTDDDGGIGTATTTITVANRAPVANPASLSAVSATPTSLTLSGSDPDGDALTFVIVSAPTHGTLSGTGPTVTYTSAAGYVGSDSFGFAVSDGQSQSPTVVVPITVTAPSSVLRLSLADDPTRTTNLRPLDGAVLTGGASAYIFVGPNGLANVRRVSFSLDGKSFSTEQDAPYDFAATSDQRSCKTCAFKANPFESNLLSLGTHRITATVVFRNGTRTTLDATFTVAGTTPHRLVVSSSANRTSPTSLDGATLSGRRYVFLGDANDPIAGLSKVTFFLDGKKEGTDSSAPYDAFGTGNHGTPNAFDTRRLRNGNHRITAIVELDGGGTVVYEAVFRVAN